MQSAQAQSEDSKATTINALSTEMVVEEVGVPVIQPCPIFSTNSLSPATTTCSSNDSSTNTSSTVAEPRPSIIPPIQSNENLGQQQNEPSPPPTTSTQEHPSHEQTLLPVVHSTPNINEKKLSTASAAPLLQHILPVVTHQPLADIKDLENALNTTLGIHRSVSVAPNFPPYVPANSDGLSTAIDQASSTGATALTHRRVDSGSTIHDDAMVDSTSIDAHRNLYGHPTNDAPRFSIDSSRPASAQSPLITEELRICENCQIPMLDARVFCGIDCAQKFSLLQVCTNLSVV